MSSIKIKAKHRENDIIRCLYLNSLDHLTCPFLYSNDIAAMDTEDLAPFCMDRDIRSKMSLLERRKALEDTLEWLRAQMVSYSRKVTSRPKQIIIPFTSL